MLLFKILFFSSKLTLTCDQLKKLQNDANSPVKYPCPMPVGPYSKTLTVDVPKIDLKGVPSFLASVSVSKLFLLY